MRFLLMAVVLVLASQIAVAEEAAFVYDDHGKHDPFWPLVSSGGTVITYDTDLTASDMVLEGIVAGAKGNNMAIVNGKVVKSKDNLGAYTVDQVGDDYVEITKGEEHFTLKLKKGGM